jgi:hypothetical protein
VAKEQKSGMARTRRQPSAARPAPGRQIEAAEDHSTPHRVTLDLSARDFRTLGELCLDARPVGQMDLLRAMLKVCRERPQIAETVVEEAKILHKASRARRYGEANDG